MDSPSNDKFNPRCSSALVSATLASADLLLNPESLLELVGFTGESDALNKSNAPSATGHWSEGRLSGLRIVPKQNGPAEGNIQNTGRKIDICREGAALALRLVERLLGEALPENRTAGELRTAKEADSVDKGEQQTGEESGVLDALGSNGKPVLSHGQFLELVCLHFVLTRALQQRGVFHINVAAEGGLTQQETGEVQGKLTLNGSPCFRKGLGLPTLLQLLDLIDSGLMAPVKIMPRLPVAGASLVAVHLLAEATETLEGVHLEGTELEGEEGVTVELVGPLVHQAVRIFRNSCPSALQLAGIDTTLEGLAGEVGVSGAPGRLEDLEKNMPAFWALAGALGVDANMAGLASMSLFGEGRADNREDREGSPAGCDQTERKVVQDTASEMQLATLTALAAAFEWAGKCLGPRMNCQKQSSVATECPTRTHASDTAHTSNYNPSQTRNQGTQPRTQNKSETQAQTQTQNQNVPLPLPNESSGMWMGGFLKGCLSPAECAAAVKMARGLLGDEDSGVGAEEGLLNPLGQLLVYMAVIVWMELEAGAKVREWWRLAGVGLCSDIFPDSCELAHVRWLKALDRFLRSFPCPVYSKALVFSSVTGQMEWADHELAVQFVQ
jgi:hypothetical protein